MKKILAMILVAVMLFSVPASAAWENNAFSKDFETVEEMCAYIKQYAEDYPHVEYGEIETPIRNYEQKNKDFLLVSINDPEYVLTELRCYERPSQKGYGLHYTSYTFEKNNGEVTARLDLYYGENAYDVIDGMEEVLTWVTDHEYCCDSGKIHSGEIGGYKYIGHQCLSDMKTSYRIAADDVFIECYCIKGFDDELINNLVIEKSGIEFPVLEYNPNVPIRVTDEVLELARKEYNDDSITKEDITVTNYSELGYGRLLLRYTVAGYDYTDDEVEQSFGNFKLYVPQRPVPQIIVDGVVYDFAEAYDAGILSDDELSSMSGISYKYFKLTEISTIPGDVDGNKRVDVLDASYIQRYLCGYYAEIFNETLADYNGDGDISIFDATGIQRHLARY